MSDVNSLTDDDITDSIDKDNTMVNHDIVKDPETDLNLPDITLVADDSNKAMRDKDINDDELNVILQHDINFQIANDKIQETLTLQQVEDKIIAKETICKQDAKKLLERFDDFINHISLEEFSEVPTQINYDFTKDFVKTKVENAERETVDAYKLFLDTSLKDLSVAINKLHEEYIPLINSCLTTTRLDLKDLIDNISNNKNLVVPIEDVESKQLVNLGTEPLVKIVGYKPFAGMVDTKPLLACLTSMKFKAFIRQCVNNTTDDIFNPAIYSKFDNDDISLIDIINFISSNNTNNVLEIYEARLEELKDVFTNILDQFSIVRDFIELTQFTTAFNKDIYDAINLVKNLYKIIYLTNSLLITSRPLLDHLTKL